MESKITPQEIGRLFTLKSPLLLYLLNFLDFSEVLKIKNRHLYKLIFSEKNKNFLNSMLKAEITKKILNNRLKPNSKISNLDEIVTSINSGHPYFLPLMGYFTTGGFQYKMLSYNYPNIFRINKSIHCSEVGRTSNINIGAIFYPQAFCNNIFCLDENDKDPHLNIVMVTHPFHPRINIDNNTRTALFNMVSRHSNDSKSFTLNQRLVSIEEQQTKLFPNKDSYTTVSSSTLTHFNDSNLITPIINDEDFPNTFFVLSNIFVLNDDTYTCPLRTFALFTHDETLGQNDNVMLSNFEYCSDIIKLNEFILNNPKYSILRETVINEYGRAVEFSPDEQTGQNLKLVCWVYLFNKSTNSFIDVTPFKHFGKYIVLKFFNTVCDCKQSIDISKFLLFGQNIKIEN